MKDNAVKIGLFGVGHFGKYHLQNLQQSAFDLVGFYDIDKDVSNRIEKDYGVRAFADAYQLFLMKLHPQENLR